MSKLERNESSLYYQISGSGSPILLTHGFAATSRMWRGQVEAFRDKHQVITWDMRGHGRSDSPSNQAAYSVEETVADMTALLDMRALKEISIVGAEQHEDLLDELDDVDVDYVADEGSDQLCDIAPEICSNICGMPTE